MSAAGRSTRDEDVQQTSIRAGGLSWDVGTAGEWDADPLLLLHGFPEHWRTWRRIAGPLASEGFRVHAACLPGYGGTTPPPSYLIDDVAAQVAALCLEIGHGHCQVVGHDWGGIIASAVASLHPGAIRSVALCCCAHPAAFPTVLKDPRQAARSSYVALFQLPGIEHVLGRREVMTGLRLGLSEIETADEMGRALAYYRANLRPWDLHRSGAGRIRVPGLVVHAGRDPVITERLMRETATQFDDLRGFEVLDCGHFVHRECPTALLEVLLPFLRGAGRQS